MRSPEEPTTMLPTTPNCQRCRLPATVLNQGQPFCDECWDAVRDSWAVCLSCGQIFETPAEHWGHVADHQMYPVAGGLHYSRTFQFTTIAG
jgi:predicted amidophosphoribosyltransferase